MRFSNLLLRLWPGLPRLWHEGHAISLVIAIGFALFANGLLLASFSASSSSMPHWLQLAWLAAGGIWVGFLLCQRRATSDSELPQPNIETEPVQDLISEAQLCYLAGEWDGAESILDRMLSINSEDIEARLLLVSVLRRTGRLEPASSQLVRCRKSERGFEWIREIEQEKKWLGAELEDRSDETEAVGTTSIDRSRTVSQDDFDGGESEPTPESRDVSETSRSISSTPSNDDSSLKAA